SGVGPVHVPLSRRRLLRQWRTRFGAASARSLSLRLPSDASRRRAPAGDPGAALSNPAGHLATSGVTGRLARGEPAMKRWLLAVGNWFDARLRLRATLLPMMRHPIPREVAGPMGWWYTFGSASLTLLLVQILTGIGLALVYVPAADKAYDSLLYMDYQQPLGWFLRALHYYAGSGMVVLVLAHMTQVFLHGAYKYPRELTWVLGVFLLLCTLG